MHPHEGALCLVLISKFGERELAEEHLFLRAKRLARLLHWSQKAGMKD
jgi:hypothetical protein